MKCWLADRDGVVVGELEVEEGPAPGRVERDGRGFLLLEEREDGSAVYLEEAEEHLHVFEVRTDGGGEPAGVSCEGCGRAWKVSSL